MNLKQFLTSTFFVVLLYLLISIEEKTFNSFNWNVSVDAWMFIILGVLLVYIIPLMLNYLNTED